eukprot:scpid73008/ scgid21922/ Coiled-coil domain-containing protein 151
MTAVPTDRYYRNVVDVSGEIEETKIRDKLLHGDAKAYLEAARAQRDQNADRIRLRRLENKKKREELATRVRGDEHVVAAAFSTAGKSMPPRFRGMPCRQAIGQLDRSVSLGKKRLDLLQYKNRQRVAKMESLETLLRERQVEYTAVREQEEGESEDTKRLRALENDLMRMNLKLDEGRHMNTIYRKIVNKMKEDRLHYDRLLKAMGIALNEKGKSYAELAAIYDNALDATEDVKAFMTIQEEQLQHHREKNEDTLSKYQKLADKNREQSDKGERRLHRASIIADESSVIDMGKSQDRNAAAGIDKYQAIIQKVATAIGVTSPDEVTERFLNQSETHRSLKVAAEQSQMSVNSLKEEKEELESAFEKLNYAQEAKVSRGQQMLEEVRREIHKVKSEETQGEAMALEVKTTLDDVKSGVEHLSQKLVHLKEPTVSVPTHPVSKTDEEYVLDLLASCEAKLCALAEQLEEREVDILSKEMEDVEFRTGLAGKLPEVNFRIDLSSPIPEKAFGDDEESGDDNDVLTRDKLKREAQEFTDAKTKKKKKKKK